MLRTLAYHLGRATRRHPLLAMCGIAVVFAAVAFAGRETPREAAVVPAAEWKAPVDPADTPARRERHRQARETAAAVGALDRMK